MKKHFSVLLILGMTFMMIGSMLVSAETSGSCGDNLTWKLEDGILTISGEGELADYYISAPWYNDKENIKSIIIENGVKSIGGYAFNGCLNLSNITIPDSVTKIGYYAFNGCSNLSNITIPRSVTSIGEEAFANTAYYKDGSNWVDEVLYIDKHLIRAQENIAGEYTVKQGTVCIADNAFSICSNLSSIAIPDSVTSIGHHAFVGCLNLSNITIPNGVTVIDIATFAECNKLESIAIPDSVTKIERAAFLNCMNLKNITGGNNVTSVADGAFLGTAYYDDESNLTDEVVYIGSCLVRAKNNLIANNYEIRPGTISIVDSAFSGCTNLNSVIIPESVTNIGDSVFYGCSNLSDITMPSGITNIGRYTFDGCSNLSSITIPSGITNIGDYAFGGCSNLSNITIPNSVTNIGFGAFASCSKLTDLIIPNSVTAIDKRAFSYCDGLTNITISNKTTNIDDYVFYRCKSLKNITIPDSVTKIGEYAFDGCSALTSINLGSAVTEIGNCAFNGCNSLTDIYYNNTLAKYQEIYIDNGNKPFIQATKHYVSDTPIIPDDPTGSTVIVGVKPMKGIAGDEITIPIYIKNNPGMSGFSFKINYNIAQLVPLSITKNANLPGSLTSNIEQPGNYTGLEYVTAVWSNASDYSEDGELFYITFRVYSTIKKGTYIPIRISSTGDIINQDYEEITATLKNGSVIMDFIYGDIYGDGVLDNKDLVRMRQYLADWDITLTDEEKKAADVYYDGAINNKDLVRLSQYFADWNVKLGK